MKKRQASLDQLAAHAEVAAARERVGDASEYEALRAQVELANHRPLLVEAQNRLLGARDRLTRLLGLDPSDPVDVAGSLESAAPSPPGAAEEALAERAVASAELRFARGETLYPEGVLP